MITKKVLFRGEAAKDTHYYEDQADDYYSKDGGAAVWQGEGARLLGLSGEVDTKRFQAMLAGNFGHGIEASGRVRKDSNARSGIDLTISAPKSVTIQALVGGDERVIAAHDAAVTETLAFIEKHLAESRQTIKGQNHVEKTGNLIIAKFRHETARSVDGFMPDPQLHTHAIIMNLTQREDGTWASVHNDNLVKLRALQDTVYMAALARELKAVGYEIRHEPNHIELAHITRDEIKAFSKRTAQIEKRLAGQGLSKDEATHGARQVATLATRTNKDQSITREELYRDWTAQAAAIGMTLNADLAASKERASKQKGGVEIDVESRQRIADAAVLWAVKHMTERETVMEHSKLLSTALLHAEGVVSVEQVETSVARMLSRQELVSRADYYKSNTALDEPAKTREAWAMELSVAQALPLTDAYEAVDQAIRNGRFSKDDQRYATQTAFQREQRILAMEKAGRGAVKAVISADALHEKLADTTLTPGQKSAVELMLSDKDQIVGIQGLAGTGKSFALQSTQKLLNEQGYTMLALAPYGTQVASLRSDGIEAKTVASQLTATDTDRLTSKLGEKTVVVVDEAGVIPVRQMDQLLAQLQSSGARIVLLGDTGQTQAIEAGRAFSMLQERGMKTAVMGDIQRQKSERLKRAVELAATGKAKESLSLIDRVAVVPDRFSEGVEGRVRDSSQRYETIAREYTNLSLADQAETLIVTGTNASRIAINALVHEYRGLSGKGHVHTMLTRHDTTRMQRRHAKYYGVGDIVQPERDYKNGMVRGELYEVVKCDLTRDRIYVRSLSNSEQEIEVVPKTMSNLSVFHQHKAELSAGDVVRVTRHDAARDLANGQHYEVLNVTEKSVTLSGNGRVVTLPTDKPLHLDHAYATTAHSAQGLTCDTVFYNAESFSRTTGQDTYYVSISRERHNVVVFTDDEKKLPSAISRVPYKGLAHDLVSQKHGASHGFTRPEHTKQATGMEIR